MSAQACIHLAAIKELKRPKAYECEECVRMGGSWVHLRTCQFCGVTLCCDSSPNKHASRHAEDTKHPVVASAEPGERWMYCYVHEQMASY